MNIGKYNVLMLTPPTRTTTTCIKDFNLIDELFLKEINEKSDLQFVEQCEQLIREFIDNDDLFEMDIKTSSAFHRKIVHIIAKKYKLHSVRSGKYVKKQSLCDSCDYLGFYNTTIWKNITVSKYPLEKTISNEKTSRTKQEMEKRNHEREIVGLPKIARTRRTSFDTKKC